MSTEALEARASAYEKQARAEAIAERLMEVEKEQLSVEEQLTESKALLEEGQNKVNEANEYGGTASLATIQSMQEQKSVIDELEAKQQELAEQKKTLSDQMTQCELDQTEAMVEAQAEQDRALAESVANQTVSLEDLTEAQQNAVSSMQETWQGYLEQATNMFDTLSDETELSVAEMTENLLENQRIVGEWAENIDELARRGVDEGLLEQLRQAGPESAGYVKAMVEASDPELQALSDAFANGGETATTALKTAFDTSEVPDGIMNLVTQSADTLTTSIADADFASIGQMIPQGLNEGITANSGEAAAASAEMAQQVNDEAANVLGVHSPSTVFRGYGQDLINGLVLGINGSAGKVKSALSKAMLSAGKTAVKALTKSLNVMNTVSTAAFTKIVAAARSGMNRTASAITSGMQKSVSAIRTSTTAMATALQAGMSRMRSSATSGMNGIMQAVSNAMNRAKTAVSSGMSRIKQAISSGMSAARSRAASGASRIASAFSGLRSRLYSAGYYAAAGLASGISSGGSVAIAAAQRVANRVAAIMRTALKVSSPSKVTAEIGGYASEGLAVGMLKQLKTVENAADRIAQAAVPDGNISRRVSSFGGYSADVSFVYQGNVDSEYYFEIPVILDGREIARASAPYNQEELDRLQRRSQRKLGYT